MIDLFQINPGLWMVLAGMICALVPKGDAFALLRKAFIIGAPIFAAVMITQIYTSQEVIAGKMTIGGLELTTLRIDNLSMVWGYLFCLIAVLNGIFGFHEKCRITDSSALVYAGAAIAGVFAGDLLTLFLFWELTAISSVFLIWRGGESAYAAGIRYLALHVLSGVILLAGAIIHASANGGDYTFNHIGLETLGGWLILIAIGIKCGFPFLHMWMQDAYPKASITGTVILSAFTTKMAIYALARGYVGVDILIYIGAVMTCFPVFFALIENDLRRVLSFSLNNQLGFMVCGIGIGTELALNGVVGQVFVHVIFKSLLFMSIGAVMYRVGTAKASELGGLFRSMPFTTVFCLIGAGSIAAFPLLAAFVTKAMIISSVIYEAHHNSGLYVIAAMLLFASAGVMEHSGIKVPYFTFFSHDSGRRVKEAPWNMLVAMGLASALCIFLAFPWGGYQMLYSLMPYDSSGYTPYTVDHVVFQLQLLFAAISAFCLLKKVGLYPSEKRAEILDFDWTYRKLGLGIMRWIGAMWTRLGAVITRIRDNAIKGTGRRLYQMFSPAGAMSEAAPSGLAAALTAGMLILVLIFVYFVR
ncbi:MAG: Na(+)/H(+) antiporter subunit D [Hellea sp.]